MAKTSKLNETLQEQEKIQQERVEQRVSSVEKFFNENKKIIWGTLIAILVVALAILGYQKFIMQPQKAEAAQQLFPAEASFRAGDYELALNGDGNVLGFAQVISQYGAKAGASVYFYAGICELNLSNWQNALDYLKKYNGKDEILAAAAIAAQGDALSGLEKYAEAVACYEKAAKSAKNMYSAEYLLKAGLACEKLGDSAKALSYYKEIKDQHPQTVQGYDIDKYIIRIESAK